MVVKDHSGSESENPLLPLRHARYFIALVTPVVEDWLEQKLALDGSSVCQNRINPWPGS